MEYIRGLSFLKKNENLECFSFVALFGVQRFSFVALFGVQRFSFVVLFGIQH
jgi:hypothetical protein